MAQQRIKPAYARFDPAHLFDGLFVPTKGKKHGRLLVEPRRFGKLEIGFHGYEQLGAQDQSILLALTAQLGIARLVIDATSEGPVSKQLRLALDFNQDDGAPLASKRTSLRSLLIDAGYNPDTSTDKAKDSLNRLRATQIREIDRETGWDRVCNLISVSFNHKTREIHVAANPRLTGAVFRGQHVKVSLFERNELESEVAKLLHCWLCSNIRLGRALGNSNGAHLDTLAPHVWGRAAWEGFSKQSKSQKRGLLRDALEEIADRTRGLQGGIGWAIDQTSSGLVLVSRPKELPLLEGEHGMTPSEYHEIMSQPPDSEPFNWQDWTLGRPTHPSPNPLPLQP
ncbi:MAG: replication protein C, IncQ-type [Pseudomonas sp.]|uniref:replication protein C, IncQ-type n=1 Tax=unclassified Pseudomonas TaxID=196821 RepID=UPI0021C64096|nr:MULTISPECIES: replication protein C, IncQ-type [unclassified Pseudomonas]MCU1772257.1 replication protein C, IncQ-type [Pseudomonas sp. 13B_3.2_Bac1]MDO9332585.1 replication protein C, IncQ-type [Pseudomonas sp.]